MIAFRSGPGMDEHKTFAEVERAAAHFVDIYEYGQSESLDREEDSAERHIRRLETELERLRAEAEEIAQREAPGDDKISRSKRNNLALAGRGIPAFGPLTGSPYDELRRISDDVRRIRLVQQRKAFDLRVLRNVRHQLTTFGDVRLDELRPEGYCPPASDNGAGEPRPKPPYPAITVEYLRLAYEWLEAGHRPKGDKPTELWQHLRSETGATLRNLRGIFERHGWYNPKLPYHEGTLTEYTVREVLKEGRQWFGKSGTANGTRNGTA